MYLEKKRKKRIPRKTVIFLITILVVVVVFITGLIMLLTQGRDIEDSLILIPAPDKNSCLAVETNIVYSESDLLTCVDASLNNVWQVKLFTAGLDFTSNGSLIAATGEDVVMILDAKGDNLFPAQLDGKVVSVRLGKDKVAVYADQELPDETRSYIVIFDLSGTSLFQIDITEKYVLDYGFDSQSSQFYILELDISGAAPVSRITTYRPETQSITGIKELKDQLIGNVILSGDAIYTMGTKRLSMYQSLNSDPREILIYGWVVEDICTAGNRPVFVYIPNNDNEYIDIVRIIRTSGDETKINLPPNVFKIVHTMEKIYCFASNNIFVYTSEGRYLRTYDIPFIIDGVRRAMDGYVFLTAEDRIYLLPLP